MIKYYYLKMIQQAPLRLSNGDNDETDSDLMLNRQGFPFVPGSSLAGVLRSMLNQEDGDYLFGRLKDGSKTESRMIVSDAVLAEDIALNEIKISHRDGVGLNEYGVAKPSAKFDFQIVETNKPYTAVLEIQTGEGDRADSLAEKLMKKAAAEGLSFGARTTRGYGKMSVEISCVCFALDTEESLKEWLNYDPRGKAVPSTAKAYPVSPTETVADGNDTFRISADVTFDGSISVRVYLTSSCPPNEKKRRNIPDYVTMKNPDGQPVIPGTSLAGAFRHHMLALAEEIGSGREACAEINRAFGVAKDEILKSRIRFGETVVSGGSEKIVKRIALERFTAAPKNGGLYCSSVWYGGEGKFEISLKPYSKEKDKLLISLLLQTLRDMHYGLMNFGGEGGVGRGTASITQLTVNGKDHMDFILNDNAPIDLEGF